MDQNVQIAKWKRIRSAISTGLIILALVLACVPYLPASLFGFLPAGMFPGVMAVLIVLFAMLVYTFIIMLVRWAVSRKIRRLEASLPNENCWYCRYDVGFARSEAHEGSFQRCSECGTPLWVLPKEAGPAKRVFTPTGDAAAQALAKCKSMRGWEWKLLWIGGGVLVLEGAAYMILGLRNQMLFLLLLPFWFTGISIQAYLQMAISIWLTRRRTEEYKRYSELSYAEWNARGTMSA